MVGMGVGSAVGLTAGSYMSPLTGIWLAAATPVDASRAGFQDDQAAPELQDSRLRRLQFQTLAYTSAVASDVGKAVVGAESGDSGTLVSYDNTYRQWWVLADTAADLFDYGGEVVSITSGTGVGTQAGVAELGYAPESAEGISTSLALVHQGGTVVVGTYTDEQGLTCSLSGTFTPSTGAVALTGSAGDFDITVTLTLSAGVLSGSYPTGGITLARNTDGDASEVRDVASMVRGAAVALSGTHYYVDALAGDDGYSGTCAAPFETLGGLPALSGGETIHLARGSRWREGLIDSSNNVSVIYYGVGPRPIADASDLLSSWSKTGGLTNVYEHTHTPAYTTAGNGTYLLAENGIVLERVADTSTCDSTPGSFVAPDPDGSPSYTIYTHATGSTDPTSDGKVRECASREGGVVLSGTGCSITGIHGRLNAGDDGSVSVKGASGALYDCVCEWGGLHNWFATAGATVQHVVALWEGEATVGGSMGVCYVADGNGQSATVTDYAAIQYDRADLLALARTALLAHIGGGDPWDSIAVNQWGAFGCGKGLSLGADAITSTQGLHEKTQGSLSQTVTNTADGGSLTASKIRSYNHSIGGTQPTTSRAFSASGTGAITLEDIIITTPASSGGEVYGGGNMSLQRMTIAEVDGTGTSCAVDDSAAGCTVTAHTRNLYVDLNRNVRLTVATVGVQDGASDYNQSNAGVWQLNTSESQMASFAAWIAAYTSSPTEDQNSSTDAATFAAEADADRPIYSKTDGYDAGSTYSFEVSVDQPMYDAWRTFVDSL